MHTPASQRLIVTELLDCNTGIPLHQGSFGLSGHSPGRCLFSSPQTVLLTCANPLRTYTRSHAHNVYNLGLHNSIEGLST